MNKSAALIFITLFLIIAGCTLENPDTATTPAPAAGAQPGSAAPATTTPAAVRPGTDPLVGVWRITNSQGYDDRFRFSADGTYAESYYDTGSSTTWIHTGTWAPQGTDTYTVNDRSTGQTRTLNYFPDAQSIRFSAMPHLVLKPFYGDIAAGVPYATAPPATATVTGAGAAAVATQTTASRALDKPLHLSGVGDNMVYFQAKHPGDVTFHIYYNYSEGYDTKCIEDSARFTLAGPTLDKTLYGGDAWKLHDADHTLRLPVSGRYSITVKGCWGWLINIDNAESETE